MHKNVSETTGGSDGKFDPVAEQLRDLAAQLQENYPGSLLHRVLAITDSPDLSDLGPEVFVTSLDQTLKPFMLDLGGRLIPELGGLAKSFQAMQSFSSPLARDGSQDVSDTTSALSVAGRRGSLQPSSSSQGSTDLKASNRMSMPAHLMSSANGVSGPGPHTPAQGGRESPATTFDDIPGAVPPQVMARMSTPPSKTSGSRESSADRASTSGFGSNTLNERNRLKQQGRLSCIVGSLYLQAGLWSDALKELSETIAKARSCSDHLWHAKAFENAVVCLLLLAWNGIGFRIPDVCYPSSTRPLAARGPQAPSEISSPTQPLKPEEVAEAMKSLYEMLPDMISTIRDLYLRTVDIPGENLTPSAYSEINIRFARLLTGLSGMDQTDETMRQMKQTNLKIKAPTIRRGRNLAKQASDLLHSAIPLPAEFADVSTTETLSILGAITACYSTLGMTRKSGLILQDYLDCLIPGLVQARKLGAAEAGMHPAAGIANVHNPEHGGVIEGPHLDDILKFFEHAQILAPNSESSANLQSQGEDNIDMKLLLLRKCIRVCEALPDFDGILKCTSELLRLAGPGLAPSFRSPDVYIKVAADEQSMLSSNFYRTSDLMDNLGLSKQGGRYWDRFLVRGVEMQPPNQDLEVVQHRMADYNKVATEQGTTGRGPFLYDAFAQKPKASKPQSVLIAEESRTFSVMLQNLFDFEVFIDTIELLTNHEGFRPLRRDLRLSPHRMQVFMISGTPQTAGKMRVTGCRIAVKGCAIADFEIFPDPWVPPESVKIFRSANRNEEFSKAQPKPFTLEATIASAQPRLEISAFSLPERSIEVHEGERKTFEVEIYNASKVAAANFIKIFSQDNIKLYLLSALKERDLSPPLRYEIEHQLYIEPVLSYQGDSNAEELQPQQKKVLRFEILGKPGLMHMSAILDYAFLEDPTTEGQIYTRTLAAPLTVTVKPSVRVASFQLTPLSKHSLKILPPRETHCWMTLDFQNLSSKALMASVKLKGSTTDAYTELVPPKAMGSISCAVPKLYLENAHAAVPSLDPSKEQQFVVRTSGGALFDEREERERFWYGHELINSLSATWQDHDSGANGNISLRDIVLSPVDVATLSLDDVSVLWSGELEGEIAAPSTARFKVINRSRETLRLELQLYRTISGFVDRIAGGHVENKLLSIMKPQSEILADFEVTFECKGHHMFLPSIVERDHAEGGINRPSRTWHGEPRYVTI